jgi:hypothetical protein
MLGKIRPDLPSIGKSIGRARDAFCQCSANLPHFCQALAKSKKRAAENPPRVITSYFVLFTSSFAAAVAAALRAIRPS